jgi:outer membrane protein assembly factor BamB
MQRLLLAAALLVGLGLGLGRAAPAQTMFRGDAARQGGDASQTAPRTLLGVKWRFPTGDRIVSSPVMNRGVIFVGSDDGHLYAVDAATGTLRWRHATRGPVASTPAVADGRVIFASYDGRIRAVDEVTGVLLWSFATQGERRFEARGLHGFLPKAQTYADPFDVYLSSPALADGVVYIGSGDGRVYALDAASGLPRWAFDTGEVVHASPAVAQGLVVVGSWNGRLYGLDARTGAERWRFQAGVDPLIFNQQGFQSSPVIHEGRVFVGCRDAHLYALELASGRELWRFSTGASWVIASPVVAQGRVFFATSDSSLVHAVEAATGQAVWQQQDESYMFSSPVVAGDALVIGVLNGSLAVRELATGALRWRWRTEAAQANRGWVLTADHRLNGPMLYPSLWREQATSALDRQSSVGSLFSTPLVVGGVVYVGSADGALYALE